MTKQNEATSRRSREAEIETACDAGRHDEAVRLLLEAYADELLSFLVARLRDRGRADEAFSLLAEDLWLGLPKFEFRSSVRTWAYALARHALARYARSPARRPERNLTLSKNVALSQLVERVRSQTRPHLRTEVKDRVRALREQLDPDDQTLLILRVDRQMGWRDLARVMREEGADDAADDARLDQSAARLRKRFERIKAELKRRAMQEGLWQ